MTKKMTSDAVTAVAQGAVIIEEKERNKKLPYDEITDPVALDKSINPDDLVHPYATKSVISITDRVLVWDNIQNMDPDVRLTKGTYFIKYYPKTSRKYKKGRPFQIGQDLVRWSLKISGYSEWKALCKVIPELAWIDRHTHLDPFLFNIARMHPNIWFSFSVDWCEYVKMLLDKANAEGISLVDKNSPLIAFRPSKADYEKKYKGKAAFTPKSNKDYAQEIHDIEHDPVIKAEMFAETGHTIDDVLSVQENLDLHRCTTHDPKTGRFVKKKRVEFENINKEE